MKKLVLTIAFITGTILSYGQVNSTTEPDSESYGEGAGTEGAANSFFGHKSGRENTGSDNSFFGKFSGLHNKGKGNVFIGIEAGMKNQGKNNVFIGNSSGDQNTTGFNNVYLGTSAGTNNTTGDGNVFIGYNSGPSIGLNGTPPVNNKLYIDNTATNDPLIFGNFYKRNLTFNGQVGIGTYEYSDSIDGESYMLSVAGKVRAESVKVYTDWADYVFEDDYILPTLNEVEDHINAFGHLKDIPSAVTVETNGIELGEMNKLLLQKIEELTLYTIEQEKRIKALEVLITKKQ